MSTEEKRPLPEGWSSETIPNLVPSDGVFSDGDWVETKDQDPNGDVRLIQLADVGDGYYRDRSERFLTHAKAIEMNCTFLEKGDVLIARMPDPLGRACIFPGDEKESVTVVDVCIVRTMLGETNHKWLMYWVNTPVIRAEIEKYQSGTTRKRISRKNLAKIEFPVPPRPEQARIVAEIDKQFTRLDQAVASLKRAQVNLQRYKASVLKAACDGRLVPQDPNDETAEILLQRILAERRAQWEEQEWAKLVQKAQKKVAQDGRKAQNLPARLSDLEPQEWQDILEAEYGRYLPKNDKWKEKYKEPEAPDTVELPPLPDGWMWATPEQLSSTKNYSLAIGPFGSNLKVVDYRDEGVPLIFVRQIRSGIFDGLDTKYVSREKANELNAHAVNGGDILITKMGDPPGDAVLYPDTMPEAIITADCIKWNLSKFLREKRFFVHAINSQSVHQQILKITRGVAQLKVSLGRFKTIGVPLPPQSEQEQIVAEVERRLSVIAANEKAIAADLARAERLRQSILQRAFSGQLVQPQENSEKELVL